MKTEYKLWHFTYESVGKVTVIYWKDVPIVERVCNQVMIFGWWLY